MAEIMECKLEISAALHAFLQCAPQLHGLHSTIPNGNLHVGMCAGAPTQLKD